MGMNNKFLLLGWMSIILSGCSSMYGYQSPAPVYGEGSRTNPYDKATPDRPIVFEEKIIVSPQPRVEITQPIVVEKRRPPVRTMPVKRVAKPAILALISDANKSSKAGDLDSAVVTIERALRIDARNPDLTYKLAELRLKQSKPRLAEDLAKKTALLAQNDRVLKKRSWLLISEARRRQKKFTGAKEAKLKAESF